ncbi:N-6 DNA methylase [Oceanospirillaceae bacterium ASx5O]|nr:N-6 DNA methylase [Oceanospirillaceae bacterium ASx5O]
MITKDNLKELLVSLQFTQDGDVFSKHFAKHDCELTVDFKKSELIYPESKGLKINERQTCNFSSNENFVVFECVHRLLAQGYKPESIELEPRWQVGHGASGGRADILVKNLKDEPLLIIECKTAGKEFDKAWKDTLEDGGQLFTYIEQEKAVEFVALYASDFENDEVQTFQRIISHKDNEKILAEDKNLKAFKDAKNVKERYKVWKDTYKLEKTEKGLFEGNIQAYQIGKEKYTLDIDTDPINASDKKGKYHQFRTILRKYNVSRRENAFEVLVNLFLCKIVDETENKNDLKFYWKGIAYDNYYDLVDRLQALYQIGMSKFLKQEIVYISNDDIDKVFWAMKQKQNATKSTIKEIFRQLKFFKGLDFDFIKVHSQAQFEKNAKILLEMIEMWQGLRLLSEGQNQFLGDMFEFFLDNGIKQSEGQFFTPIPICKFIVASLPLEEKIIESNEPIKAIDYACGSGHFLNEFALAITPLVEKHKQADIKNYYGSIVGIEKEDRLAKVAKVSAFMYGQDEINIIEQDALDQHEQIKPNSFDCLVANPPFAVEDFLLTLDEEVRESFELYETVNDPGNKNIQCFFLERAEQLLAPNGVTGIIVPSSILNNSDNTHIRTREILLKHFDIVSIVELGSGTFGKTGTNTVVLFMRRKAHNPSQAEHFANRINDFFENWEEESATGGGAYEDVTVIEAYCNQQEIDFNHYQSLLKGEYNKELFACELFKEYEKTFNSSTAIKNLKQAKQFQAKTKEEQAKELEKRLLDWVITIEKDKLYYYMLTSFNPTPVLVVNAPKSQASNKKTRTQENQKLEKEFLGYEWSGAKGSEGIHYIHGETVYDIQTPLYNPNDVNDANKINTLIAKNFSGIKLTIPDGLKPYVSAVNLTDMLNFTQGDFNKVINLNSVSTKVTFLENLKKYPREKLSKYVDTNPSKSEIAKVPSSTLVSFIEMAAVSNDGFIESKVDKSIQELGSGFTYFKEDDLIFAKITPSMENGKCAVAKGLTNGIGMGSTEFHVFRVKPKIDGSEKLLNNLYLFNLLNNHEVRSVAEENMTGSSGHRRVPISFYENLKIPIPPMDIQNQIVAECEAVDQEVEQARKELGDSQNQIEQLFENASQQEMNSYRLSNDDNFEISIGKRVLKNEISEFSESGIPIYSANVFEPFGYIEKELLTDFSQPSVLWGMDGDWMVNYLPENEPFYPTDHCGVIRVKVPALHPRFVAWALNKVGQENRFSRSNRPSTERIKGLSISAPDIEVQNDVIRQVETLEARIKDAKKVIAESAERKETILNNYLK